MNWTVDNNGAYDYAADTRGYTLGGDRRVRSAAVGDALRRDADADGRERHRYGLGSRAARAENLELELRPRAGIAVRLLAYTNHANMGSYDDAIRGFLSGHDPQPDVVAYRRPGTVKTGVGINTEYAWSRNVRLFARGGWNEGHHESFAYTEVNDSVEGGGDLAGTAWQRPHDRLGVAVVSNGLSDAHRQYLSLGGQGFLLGDGTLRYGRENIVETYYTAQVWRGVFASGGVQYVDHPGYNQDRGPVVVGTLRLHIDF